MLYVSACEDEDCPSDSISGIKKCKSSSADWEECVVQWRREVDDVYVRNNAKGQADESMKHDLLRASDAEGCSLLHDFVTEVFAIIEPLAYYHCWYGLLHCPVNMFSELYV